MGATEKVKNFTGIVPCYACLGFLARRLAARCAVAALRRHSTSDADLNLRVPPTNRWVPLYAYGMYLTRPRSDLDSAINAHLSDLLTVDRGLPLMIEEIDESLLQAAKLKGEATSVSTIANLFSLLAVAIAVATLALAGASSSGTPESWFLTYIFMAVLVVVLLVAYLARYSERKVISREAALYIYESCLRGGRCAKKEDPFNPRRGAFCSDDCPDLEEPRREWRGAKYSERVASWSTPVSQVGNGPCAEPFGNRRGSRGGRGRMRGQIAQGLPGRVLRRGGVE